MCLNIPFRPSDGSITQSDIFPIADAVAHNLVRVNDTHIFMSGFNSMEAYMYDQTIKEYTQLPNMNEKR